MARVKRPTCNTSGNQDKLGALKCRNGNDAGYRSDVFGSRATCAECGGDGWKRCPDCKGTGEAES